MRGPAWTVVIPVKRLIAAKTRLRGAVPAVPHDRLVLALALDTVAAAGNCPDVAEVYLISDDPVVAVEATALGATVLPDEPDAGLNAALRYGARRAYADGRARRWVAALAADLPALRPAQLSAALRSAATAGRAYVADAAGTGTTLLAAPPGTDLDPRFGPGSAAAHAASGARALAGDWPSLRRDVDTVADLAEAAGLGLGPRTTALIAVATHPPRQGSTMPAPRVR